MSRTTAPAWWITGQEAGEKGMDLEAVNALIRSSEPAGRLWRGPLLILMGLSALLGAAWANPDLLPAGRTLAWILPHCLLLSVAGVIAWDLRQQQRSQELLREAAEAVHLQDWPVAKSSLGLLLASPIRRPSVRVRSLLAAAAVAENERHDDAAQRVYEYLLRAGLGSSLQRHAAEVALGACLLRNGQTTDAVALIDRLAALNLPGALKAQVELLALFREVAMGQCEESARRAEDRRALFRAHLGTRAGYGYALLAAAFERTGQAEAARRQWHDATLLVPPQDLVRRFPEVKIVADRYPAVEYPLA